ncbi:MAG TPA: PA14 domain-containing protein, partial [Longimicrobium sp.]
MAHRTLLAAALCAPLVLSAPLPAQNGRTFGTSGNTPFALKGQIYFIPETTERLPDFSGLQARGTISTTVLNIPNQSFEAGFPGVTDRFEWFAIRYRGAIVLPHAGAYRFRLTSDDGSRLLVDGRQVIDNDGVHGDQTAEGTAQLAEGVHAVEVQYFQGPRYEVSLVLEMAEGDGDYQPLDFGRYGAATVRQEGNRMVAQLGGSVLFDTNSSVLKPQAVAALEELKSSMLDPYPTARITVEGHTDDVGADA